MKKALSILLCYAVGVGASLGGTLSTPMGFEREELWGKVPEWGLDDYGERGSQNSSYWYLYGDGYNDSLIRQYAAGEDPYDGYTSSNPRPAYHTDPAENRGMMSVSTENALMRAFRPVDEQGSSPGIAIPEAGLFIDTLAQFTVCSEAADVIPDIAAVAANKLTCWISAPEGSGETNFVVTAGYFDGDTLVAANYVADSSSVQVVPGRWHRVTARVIANAATGTGDAVPCFALYIDGRLVKCATYATGSDSEAMDTLFEGNEFYEAKALFPSMQSVAGEYDAQGVYGVAAMGVGALDEIAVTDENPLAAEAASIEMLVACPAGIEKVVYELTALDAEEPYATVTNDTSTARTAITVKAGDTLRLSVIADGTHFVSGEPVLSGNLAALSSHGGGEYRFVEGEFASADRLVARVEVATAYFKVDDDYYTTFDDALDAALESPSATVSVANDITLSPDSDNGQARVRAGQSIVLDLAGRAIRGRHFQDEAAIYNQGHLVIIDSVGGGLIEAPGTAIEVVRDADALENNHAVALLEVGLDGSSDFTVRGVIRNTLGELAVRGGTFLNPSWASDTEFYLAAHLPDSRYEAVPFTGTDGHVYFRVANSGGKHIVRFEAHRGTVSPASTNVNDGEVCAPASIDAPGYTFHGWMLGDALYDFSTPVTDDLTLVASLTTNVYAIAYDEYGRDISSYTVEYEKRPLAHAERPLYTFVGWQDVNTGYFVDTIGGDSKFAGTDIPVLGDLNLASRWTANELGWSNTEYSLSESNGTYRGVWQFTIPAAGAVTNGMRVKISEIDLCIVNPHLYPKTAERIAVRPAGAADAAVSEAREIPLDTGTMQYVGYGLLKNGRPKVGYTFAGGVTVAAGRTNELWFCEASGERTAGFLRFAHTSDPGHAVIGNCDPSAESSPIPRYSEFCPLYEIRGEAADE